LPLEQGAAKVCLERAHLLAHRGLRERHAIGRGRERTLGRDGEKRAKDADAAHGGSAMLKKTFSQIKALFAFALPCQRDNRINQAAP
jgi:hypothetical protein